MTNGISPALSAVDGDGTASYRKPYCFLQKLLRDVGGLSVQEMNQGFVNCAVIADEKEEIRGATGSPRVHFCWIERRYLQSITGGLHVEVKTFGLPEFDLEWNFTFENLNKRYALFDHGRLRVRFHNQNLESRFVALWNDFFRREPSFVPSERAVLDLEPELLAIHAEELGERCA